MRKMARNLARWQIGQFLEEWAKISRTVEGEERNMPEEWIHG
jgi:hypothetical protein